MTGAMASGVIFGNAIVVTDRPTSGGFATKASTCQVATTAKTTNASSAERYFRWNMFRGWRSQTSPGVTNLPDALEETEVAWSATSQPLLRLYYHTSDQSPTRHRSSLPFEKQLGCGLPAARARPRPTSHAAEPEERRSATDRKSRGATWQQLTLLSAPKRVLFVVTFMTRLAASGTNHKFRHLPLPVDSSRSLCCLHYPTCP